MDGRQRTRPAKLVTGALLFVAIDAAGCSVAGHRHDEIPEESYRCRLRCIETVPSQMLSTTPPETVEASAPRINDEIRVKTEQFDQVALTLAEVRAAALGNNLDLQVELLNPQIVQEFIPIEQGRFDALLGLGVARTHLDTPGVVGIPGSMDAQFDSRAYEAQLTLPSRTGGTLQIARPLASSQNDGAPKFHESDWRFSFSQPLLRGAGLAINTAPIRIAKYLTLQSDASARLQVINVLAVADRQYWRVWAAQKELEIRQQQYELAEQQLEDVRKFIAAEAKAGFEEIRAEAGLAQRVNPIIEAQANLQIATRELKRLMNSPDLPIDSPVSFRLMTDPQPVGLQLDRAELASLAFANRPELAIQDYQITVEDITTDVTRNARWPLVTLDAASTINGAGTNYSDANRLLYGGRYADYSFGVNLTYPIPNQTARAAHRQALARRAQARAEMNRLSQRIQQEVYDVATFFEQNWQSILAARNNVRFATLDLDVERQLFENNEQNRTTTEVLNATSRLAVAQSAEVRALAAYQISLVDLAEATGTLLGYGRIRWAADPASRFQFDGIPQYLAPADANPSVPETIQNPIPLDSSAVDTR